MTDKFEGMFRLYRNGEHPKPKRHFFRNGFATRQKVRNFCYARSWIEGLVIVHPDGTEEPYIYTYRGR